MKYFIQGMKHLPYLQSLEFNISNVNIGDDVQYIMYCMKFLPISLQYLVLDL